MLVVGVLGEAFAGVPDVANPLDVALGGLEVDFDGAGLVGGGSLDCDAAESESTFEGLPVIGLGLDDVGDGN